MSSTNRGGERDVLDRYYTPQALADAIVAAIPLNAVHGDGYAVEPSVGGGAFVRAVHKLRRGLDVIGLDIDPNAEGLAVADDRAVVDFADWRPWGNGPRLIIGNPPFRHAEAHIRHALSIVAPGGTVCFLLRLAMLEGQARRAFWREHPPTEVLVLSKRPSFTGGATDSAAYGVFRWTDGAARLPVGWLDW